MWTCLWSTRRPAVDVVVVVDDVVDDVVAVVPNSKMTGPLPFDNNWTIFKDNFLSFFPT